MNLELPGHASQIVTVGRYELLKFLRGRKIIGIIGVTVAITSLFIFVPPLAGSNYPATPTSFLTLPLNFVTFLAVIAATFFGSDAIVAEFQQRTGYALFPNPVSRVSVWLGKFLAAVATSLSVVAIYYGIIAGAAFIIYGNVPLEFALSLLFAFIYTTMAISVAFLVSSLFKGVTGSTILIFFLFIMILPISDTMLTNIAEIKPWFSPTFSSGIVTNILTVPYPTDAPSAPPPGGGGGMGGGPFAFQRYIPQVAESLGVMLTYILAASILSILILKRREMTT